MADKQTTGAQPPVEQEGVMIGEREMVAAGVKGVTDALKHMNEQGHSLITAASILSRMNQVDGFDCPGCAWPDPDDRAALTEFCENGVKAAAWETTPRRLTPEFFRRHSVDDLLQRSDYWLGQQGRLTKPMILREGARHYAPITWEDAFEFIAEKLRGLASPHEAVFYTSGRTSNEAAFLYQLWVRAYGTNNLPDCSNMCHESSGVGLGETLGIGKGSVTLEDIYQADTLIVMGQNPGTNHPRMLSALQKAKENGARIIAINPLPETGLMRFAHPQKPMQVLQRGKPIADLFLQVQVNGDVALLKAIMRLLLEREAAAPGSVLDQDFINERTDGFEQFAAELMKQDLNKLSEMCGIDLRSIRRAVEMIAQGRKVIVCWAMGLTQHKNGVQNVREIVNLLLMLGSIGKPGAGTCPVRGHSNVQGDRTMGIYDSPSADFLDRLDAAIGFKAPREHGFNTVQSIQAMLDGRATVFFSMGGNFLSATPDTERTAQALQRCELTVQVSTKLNRSHLIHGRTAVVLPCLARSEIDEQAYGPQFVTVENSMGVVHSSRGHLKPADAELFSEAGIVARLAELSLGPDKPVSWCWLVEDYDRVRDLISQVIPGFENFNDRVREPGGFTLHNSAREGSFSTPSGRAQFTINDLPDLGLPEGHFRMMTVRSHDQYNTTIYGLNDRYRGISGGRRVVFMNEGDAHTAGLRSGSLVDLISEYAGTERVAKRFVVVPYSIPSGCVATYFPEANVLVPLEHHAAQSFTPASKDVIIRIKPHA